MKLQIIPSSPKNIIFLIIIDFHDDPCHIPSLFITHDLKDI